MRKLLFLLLVAAVAAGAFWYVNLRPKLSAVERGRRLAEATGCFACHGPDGTKGVSNPGRLDQTVPSYGALMMYAKNEQEAREWIRDGVTAARLQSQTWRNERDRGALRMPAFGKRLNASQIEDLVAFVMVASGEAAPEDTLALRGLTRAGELGCVGCHGSAGRYARSNPGSLKGYVPSWDGADFPELVRNRTEFDEWVKGGVSKRFAGNPAAKYFLDRAVLRMPAYERYLQRGDLDALWAYIRWARAQQRG